MTRHRRDQPATGWARRLDRSLLPFMGPAQIGAGHPEEPEVRRADLPCPICGRPMTGHEVVRPGGQARATRLVCPA